jgi:RNA polymerase sigma-70 factor, ECF subfamily
MSDGSSQGEGHRQPRRLLQRNHRGADPRRRTGRTHARAPPLLHSVPSGCLSHSRLTRAPKARTTIEAEQTLVRRAQAGDHDAYRALYEAYLPRIHALAYRMCGDADLADDLVQAVFVRIHRALPSYRGDAPPGAWMHRVAVSVILNGLRAERRRTTREVPLDPLNEPATAGTPDLNLALERAMDGLPEESRMVVILHDVEGYSHEEIASMLGIRAGASRARLVRARARLKSALTPHWSVTQR